MIDRRDEGFSSLGKLQAHAASCVTSAERLKIMLPVVFVTIFLLLYMVFRSVTEALILIFPTLYAMTGGLLLQWYLGYNFSVAVWVGYIALFGIAVETGVVMVVYLHEALDRKLAAGSALQRVDIEQAAIEGAVQRLRPKLMTVAAVLDLDLLFLTKRTNIWPKSANASASVPSPC
jgi:Cu/Ag efflux pump CusA